MKLNPNEVRVLAALASAGGDDDFGFMSFRTIGRRARKQRRVVRLACRSLTRKGLATYGRGLWTEDGEPAGSGYAATKAGMELAEASFPKMVERIVTRFWL